jgi:hypothetical protein
VEEIRKENPVKFQGGAEYLYKEKNLSHQLLKADKRRKSGPSQKTAFYLQIQKPITPQTAEKLPSVPFSAAADHLVSCGQDDPRRSRTERS